MIKQFCALAVLSAFSASAYAIPNPPACQDVTPITAPNDLKGDTDTAPGGIDKVGPYTVVGNQKVWSFVAGANVDGSFQMNGMTWGWGLFITNGCDGQSPAPQQSLAVQQTADNTLTLIPDRYNEGTTYYVILSGISAAVGAGLDPTGPYSIVVTPNLPVSLQSFSID